MKTDRTGLYVLVILSLFASCHAYDRADRVFAKLCGPTVAVAEAACPNVQKNAL